MDNNTELKQSQEKESGEIRDKQGRFVPGVSGNPDGRLPETLEQKVVKKAIKEFIEEHKQSLAEALPKISPVLITKALTGDVSAIKEVHDRVMGKPSQEIDTNIKGEVTVFQKYNESK